MSDAAVEAQEIEWEPAQHLFLQAHLPSFSGRGSEEQPTCRVDRPSYEWAEAQIEKAERHPKKRLWYSRKARGQGATDRGLRGLT